jgi:ankyrin repeat protein
MEFSICTECYMTGKHVLNHEFDRFVTSRERVRMPARGECKRREIRGMFKFAEVVPWCDWEPQEGTGSGEIGEVVRLCGKNNDDNSRGFVEVEWKESSQKTIHMVGHKGKVELKCVDASSGGYYYPDHLPLLGAPPAQVDPAAVSTGDRVRVELEPELFQAMQEGRGVWNDLMLNVIGKVGTVVGIAEGGDLKVRYSTENLLCNICAEAVVKVGTPQFKVGDLVRVSSDMEKVRSLQKSHGDWSNAVLLMMGEVGRVYAVYTSGDVLIMGKGKSWVFNPLCLSHAADDKEETTEDNPFMKWAKMDVDEGVKLGLTTMLKNGRGEALFVATSLGEVDLLREFLTKYPDMVDFTSDGRTALHYAASAGLAEPMKILLEFHAKIEQQDDTSTRALHTSVYHGSEETTQMLVDAGADVNAQTVDGSTPAMFAAAYGKPRSLKILLASPNVNTSLQDETGNTALHAAVFSQKLACIHPLLAAGADPCMLNLSLITPLHYAARMGLLPVIEACLQHEPGCVNSKGGSSYTILHWAAYQDHLDIITLAMETRDCDVDSRSDYGQTPLHMAVGRGNTKSVEKLVMYGASVNAVDQDGCTPLYYLTSRAEGMEPPNEDSPMTYKLYKALFGKYVNESMSVMYGIMGVAALLLRKGADIHTANRNGRSPYQILPFLGTLLTVLADFEDIIEEGGHPDGSPLLRISDKQGGHGGKKARVGLYQEGGHEDEYSGGGQQRTVMIIRAPSGYADEATHVAFSEKKRGKSSGASSGATPSGAGRSIYQDVNESYAFSFYDDNDDERPYMSRGRSKPAKTTSRQSASNSTASSTTYSTAGATAGTTTTSGTAAGTTNTRGATAGTTTTREATVGTTTTRGATGGATTTRGATAGATGATGGTRSTGATGATNGAAVFENSGGATPTASYSGVGYCGGQRSTGTSQSASTQPAPPPSTSTVSGLTPSSSPDNNAGDDDLCCMCDNVVDAKFDPCGHATMCSLCAPKAKRCPLCKTPVGSVYASVCVNCHKRESKVRQNCGHWMCNSCKDSPVCAGCNAPD